MVFKKKLSIVSQQLVQLIREKDDLTLKLITEKKRYAELMTDFECEVKKVQMEERKRILAEGITRAKQTEIESMGIVVKDSVTSTEHT